MTMQKNGWAIELLATKDTSLEIAIHDEIGESFWSEGMTSKSFLGAVRAKPDARKMALRVNSIGGVIDDAKAMVNIINERAAEGVQVTAYIDGIAASAASYLLTAAMRVVMPANTFIMIHGASTGVRGKAEDFESIATLLRRTNEQIADGYAEASKRRGKNKTKEEFLALMGDVPDVYLDADQAIEWGLADEKLEPLKIAARRVSLGDLEEHAPEALRAAPYVLRASAGKQEAVVSSKSATKPKQLTLPPIEARETSTKTKESEIMKNISMALGLPEDADEATVLSTINKIKASSRTGDEIEKLVGAVGDKAIGAVRALKASETAQSELVAEVEKVKVALARRDFEAEIKNGFDKKKLSPSLAKMYNERFEAAVAKGADGSDVVEDLQGFIAHAPSIGALSMRRPVASTTGADTDGPLQFNGKTFAQMKHIERARLSETDPELYALMREDWEQAGKPAA